MYIVIGGGGKIGEFLAQTLLRDGHEVAIIEEDRDVTRRLVEILRGRVMVVHGDCCDSDIQEDAGTRHADILVATTGQDDDNLVACEVAQALYDVPRVIARVNNPKNEAIFRKLGIEGISSTTVISRMISDEAISGDMRTVLSLRQGDLVMFEVELPRRTRLSYEGGVRVADIDLPPGTLLVSVARDDTLETVSGETVLLAGDTVVVCVRSDLEDEARRALHDL